MFCKGKTSEYEVEESQTTNMCLLPVQLLLRGLQYSAPNVQKDRLGLQLGLEMPILMAILWYSGQVLQKAAMSLVTLSKLKCLLTLEYVLHHPK